MSGKIMRGTVCGDSCSKTVSVKVFNKVKHPKYKKYINISKKFLAHDEKEVFSVGDEVSIIETRPLSKRKRWTVIYKDQTL